MKIRPTSCYDHVSPNSPDLTMKSIHFLLILLMGFSISPSLQASDFEIGLSSETAQLTLRSDSSLVGWGGSDLDFGLFYNEENDFVMQLEVLQSRQASSQNPLTLGVGVKAYAGRIDATDENIFGLGLGVDIRYTFADTMPISIYFRGFVAPKITSFSDTAGIDDYVLGAQLEVLPQTTAFIGIRHLEVDSKDLNHYRLDDDKLHVGVRLTF